MLKGAGGEVARVGKRVVAGGDLFAVDTLEFGEREENFTPKLDQSRWRCGPGRRVGMSVETELPGESLEGENVRGDVVALYAVAAGGRAGEAPVDVGHADGNAINLGLQDAGGRGFAGGADQALVKRADGGGIVGLVETGHGLDVAMGGEPRRAIVTDRRCRCGGAGGGFEDGEFLFKAVVGGVADFGCGLLEVELVVTGDFGTEGGDAGGVGGGGEARECGQEAG